MKFYGLFIALTQVKYSDKKHNKVNNELMDFTLDQKSLLRCTPPIGSWEILWEDFLKINGLIQIYFNIKTPNMCTLFFY